MKLSSKHNVSLGDVVRYALRPKQELKKENNNTIIAGALSGFVTGFTAAILLAPESGSELREDIGKVLRETNEKLAEIASEAMKKIE